MKKVAKEIKQTITKYVARDGMEFNQEQACLKYEESAQCALRAELIDMCIDYGDGREINDMFPCPDDCMVYTVVPKDNNDICTLRKISHYFNSPAEVEPKISKEDIGKVLLVIIDNLGMWIRVQRYENLVRTLTAGKYKLTPVEEDIEL